MFIPFFELPYKLVCFQNNLLMICQIIFFFLEYGIQTIPIPSFRFILLFDGCSFNLFLIRFHFYYIPSAFNFKVLLLLFSRLYHLKTYFLIFHFL